MNWFKCIVLIFLLGFNASGQIIEENYFSDTLVGNLDYVSDFVEVEDGLIVSGWIENGSAQQPVVIRLNLNGELVWSTANNFIINSTNNTHFELSILEDGYIYGNSSTYSWPNFYQTLWKVDATNGNVIWNTPFYSNESPWSVKILEYDSSNFIMTFLDQNQMPAIGIMDKFTGDTLQTRSFEYGGQPAAAVDQNLNVYFGQESKLYKFSGKNLDLVLWTKEYNIGSNPMNDINEIYLDQTDNIFLMGGNEVGGLGEQVLVKAEPVFGNQIWRISSAYDEVDVADFIDQSGYLFITFRHALVGGSDSYYRTMKINKATGVKLWDVLPNMSELPTLPGSTYGQESALSVDVDCSGNVFLTGYYGDANYGPEHWGIMKLAGSNGSKLYDVTIIKDSTVNDDLSVGIGAAVFGDSPVFIGNLQETPTDVKAWYITIEPTSGTPVIRRRIGGEFQFPSRTIDIQNINDSMYVLKQHGKNSVIEVYDQSDALVWSQTFVDSVMLTAGQLSINNATLFVTGIHQEEFTEVPYFTDNAESLHIYKLNRFTGAILDEDTFAISLDTVKLIELESDENQAFIFYKRNGELKSLKYNSSGFSTEMTIELASENTLYKGSLNIVLNYSNDSLIVAGKNNFYLINKGTFSISNIGNYPSSRNCYDLQFYDNALFLAGSTIGGQQQITSFTPSSLIENWSQTYNTGTLYGSRFKGNDTLYAYGKKNDSLTVIELSQTNGISNWVYNGTLSGSSTAEIYNLQLFPNLDLMVLAGSEELSDNSSNSLLYILNGDGENIWADVRTDETGNQSMARTLSIQNDSIAWVGGSFNRITYGKEGYIFKIIPDNQLTMLDCNGSTGGSAFIDNCGICAEGSTGITACIQDCFGEWGGIAFLDTCNLCAGGNTGVTPILNINDCVGAYPEIYFSNLIIKPNPANTTFTINGLESELFKVTLLDARGSEILVKENEENINVSTIAAGMYIIKIESEGYTFKERLLIVR